MRTNAGPAAFPISSDAAALERIVSAHSLAIARLEPVFTRREQGGFGLDLIFAREREIAVIPAVRVAHEMLVEPESPVLLWPRECTGVLSRQTLDAVESLVTPWLVALSMARQVNEECIRRFSDAIGAQEFELARSAAFAGASTYRDLAAAMAPYVYALRFAGNACVGIEDRAGATGAALLADRARGVDCDLGGAELNELAGRWFGKPIFGAVAGQYDIGIQTRGSRFEIRFDGDEGRHVDVATPVPTEVCVSFDPDDAPPVRSFRVISKIHTAVRDSVLPAVPAAVGGSAGRVLIVRRSEAIRDALADGDDAAELRSRLLREGFTAEIASAADTRIDLSSVDLVHVFGVGEPDYLALLKEARSRSIPIVATAASPGTSGETRWGMGITTALMRSAADEAALSHHVDLMAVRRLNAGGAASADREPAPGFDQGVRNALSFVDVLLVSGPEEESLMRMRFGYAGPVRIAPAYLGTEAPPEPVESLAGTWDFVLAHTPIGPAANLSFLARAARLAGLPLVVAGPVVDSHYFAGLRQEVDATVVFLPRPAAGEVTGLYRAARVFADVSWWQPSLHRAARAAVSGCALVASSKAYPPSLWPGTFAADPADLASIEFQLRQAWEKGPPAGFAAAVAAHCNPARVFGETVAAYAQAAPMTPA